MITKILKTITGENSVDVKTKSTQTKVAPNSRFATFAGNDMESINKLREAKAAGNSQSGLTAAVVSEEALANLNHNSTAEDSSKSLNSDIAISQTVVTTFSEGNYNSAIETLKSYINKNNGQVSKTYWYMLLDCYQIIKDKVLFDKVADKFSTFFGVSPPSWIEQQEEQKMSVGGKNIMTLDSILNAEQTNKFKDFLKAVKEDKFCRINISQCNFQKSDFSSLLLLHKLFIDLRKLKVAAVLMGENNLITFCKTYINLETPNSTHKKEFVLNENIMWLLYLEILQWKGKNEEFEQLAFEYAVKFEISPPGWDSNGVMKFDQFTAVDNSTNPISKIITHTNVQPMFDYILSEIAIKDKIEIDLLEVERIDFSGGGEIAQFLQSIKDNPEYFHKDIILKQPNELIFNLFELVGITQFVQVIKKSR